MSPLVPWLGHALVIRRGWAQKTAKPRLRSVKAGANWKRSCWWYSVKFVLLYFQQTRQTVFLFCLAFAEILLFGPTAFFSSAWTQRGWCDDFWSPLECFSFRLSEDHFAALELKYSCLEAHAPVFLCNCPNWSRNCLKRSIIWIYLSLAVVSADLLAEIKLFWSGDERTRHFELGDVLPA